MRQAVSRCKPRGRVDGDPLRVPFLNKLTQFGSIVVGIPGIPVVPGEDVVCAARVHSLPTAGKHGSLDPVTPAIGKNEIAGGPPQIEC